MQRELPMERPRPGRQLPHKVPEQLLAHCVSVHVEYEGYNLDPASWFAVIKGAVRVNHIVTERLVGIIDIYIIQKSSSLSSVPV